MRHAVAAPRTSPSGHTRPALSQHHSQAWHAHRHVTARPGPSRASSTDVDAPSPSHRAVPEQEWATLKDFTVRTFRGTAAAFLSTREQRQKLKDTLMTVYTTPNPAYGWNPDVAEPDLLMGLMAGDVRLAIRGFRDWCSGLGLDFMLPEIKVPGASTLSDVQGSVYIKYNPKSRVCYMSPYVGKDRGVLVQLGQVQLGHFPLGLWDEDQQNPPPPLV